MHEMRTIIYIAIDESVAWYVSQAVCQSLTWAGCEKTAEQIDVLFEVEIPGNRRNIVLDRDSHPPTAR